MQNRNFLRKCARWSLKNDLAHSLNILPAGSAKFARCSLLLLTQIFQATIAVGRRVPKASLRPRKEIPETLDGKRRAPSVTKEARDRATAAGVIEFPHAASQKELPDVWPRILGVAAAPLLCSLVSAPRHLCPPLDAGPAGPPATL